MERKKDKGSMPIWLWWLLWYYIHVVYIFDWVVYAFCCWSFLEWLGLDYKFQLRLCRCHWMFFFWQRALIIWGSSTLDFIPYIIWGRQGLVPIRALNPNPTGGGGSIWPPSTFRAIIPQCEKILPRHFTSFFFLVSRIFCDVQVHRSEVT